jgi:pSer/pThr/pTyr-binding forkhead associated (FHA) protein
LSSSHARLTFREGRCFIKDLDSANKTFVRIRDTEQLVHGDILLVGNKLIKVEIK